MVTSTASGAAGAPGSVGVRDVAGAKISYRIGTTDEFVLQSQYGAHRFFPPGYVPRPDATILDIGAHIGVFAVLAARQVPGGVVHALEPSSDNFGLLQKNLRDNTAGNAAAHRLALAGASGTLRLYHAPGSVGHSFYLNPGWAEVPPEPRDASAPPLGPHEEVPAQRLAEFLTANGISEVGFMKMNIEGAEYDVLGEAPEDVLRAIGCMHVELHPEDEGLADRLIGRLQAAGFTTSVTWSDDPTVKGWLAAERG